jgi:hypothetical protein
MKPPGRRKAVAALGCAAALLLPGCGERKAPPPAQRTNAAAAGSPLTAPVDYLGAVNDARKRSVATLDLASVRQAVQLFQAAEDRLPADLNELVSSGYLAKLPALPAGQRLEYDPQTGGVRVVAK